MISFENELTSQDSFVPYLILPSSKSYSVKFRDEKSAPISKLFVSLSGNHEQLKKIVHNEYFISYSLPLTTFSLQYENKNNPIDVFVFANGSNLLFRKKVPFVVSFYKKEKSVYFLLMTPIDNETKMNQNVFEEIIEY